MNEEQAKQFIEDQARKVFSEDAGKHREFLEKMFVRLVWSLGILSLAVGLIFYLYVGKKFEGISKEAEKYLDESKVRSEFETQLSQKIAIILANPETDKQVLMKIRPIINKAVDDSYRDRVESRIDEKIRKLTNVDVQGLVLPYGTIVAYSGSLSNVRSLGWLPCDGSPLLRKDYSQLYDIIGTTFGYSNNENFFLPDLSSRAPIGAGQGDSLSLRHIGEKLGKEQHTLTEVEMPKHGHTIKAPREYRVASHGQELSVGETFVDVRTGLAGGDPSTKEGEGQPHNNMQPSLVVNFIIKVK